MSDSKAKLTNLAKNTAIFAIGTFGSRVLQFLIVPLYTYVLTTEEYGKIDLFTTTISLVLPFITLLIQEAIIRFLTSKEITESEAKKVGLMFFGVSAVGSVLVAGVYSWLYDYAMGGFLFLCLILNAYVVIFQNYLKSCENVIAFSVCGLLNTFSFLICNVILLTVFDLRMRGYFYSIIISQAISAIYITIEGKIFSGLKGFKVNKQIVKNMVLFSIPLIPNSLMWWVMNAGDKYIINYFLGDGANGLYSISIKLATIITTVFGVFMQAWQISAIKEYEGEGQKEFYEKVYKITMALLILSTTAIIVVTKPLFVFVLSNDYFAANVCSPLLCFATILNCMSTFFAMGYVITKNTKRAFTTTAIGAIGNVAANFLLIRKLGLVGVAWGTIVGYVIVLAPRIYDMKRFIRMGLDGRRSILSLVCVLGLAIAYMYMDQWLINSLCGMGVLLVLCFLYRNEVLELVSGVIGMLHRKADRKG